MSEIDISFLRNNLKTKLIGKEIIFFEKIDSTNRKAWEMAEKGAPEGTVIIAEQQERGVGRMGKRWFSPRGGLWFSVILRPPLGVNECQKITLMAGVAVADFLKELYGLKAKLKWVNDVRVKGKKISGILTEMSTIGEKLDFVILGIGVNINISRFPRELADIATSVEMELKKKVSINEAIIALVENLEEEYRLLVKGFSSNLIEKWRRLSDTLGRFVEIRYDKKTFKGIAVDVDENGFLILKVKSNRIIKITTGTCRYLDETTGRS
ncbi:biotin--[acetyl-CoA-carboxylase] ligase [Candidatus Geothermarchaeota archaeon]|nr:MAG: biotin--[acetyl-CoA-carboxylase] ligase [Candidatus Geothermarchaeota archaeon]